MNYQNIFQNETKELKKYIKYHADMLVSSLVNNDLVTYDDILHDTYIEYNKWVTKSKPNETKAKGALRVIAKREILHYNNKYQKNNKWRKTYNLIGGNNEYLDTHNPLVYDNTNHLDFDILSCNLSPKYKEILKLRFQGLEPKEIASKLNMSTGTVNSIIYHIKNIIRQSINKHDTSEY